MAVSQDLMINGTIWTFAAKELQAYYRFCSSVTYIIKRTLSLPKQDGFVQLCSDERYASYELVHTAS